MLYLYNFDNKLSSNQVLPKGTFSLNTCQRNLVLSTSSLEGIQQHYECYKDTKAYIYLLEVICGLKSRLIAENEIVAQFKTAIEQYLSHHHRSYEITTTLQKILQDQKSVRSKFLKGISQKTYAALAKKILKKSTHKNILILGSGMLAEDLINQFKKSHNVFITARNTENLDLLINKHQISKISWKDFNTYEDFQTIINTIGTSEPILTQEFLINWKTPENFFVDLGDPSIAYPESAGKDNYLKLEDIYKLGSIESNEKMKKINDAQREIFQMSKRRIKWLEENIKRRQIHENLENRNSRKLAGQVAS